MGRRNFAGLFPVRFNGSLSGFAAAALLARACRHHGAGEHAHSEKGEIHQGRRLLDHLLENGRKREIHGAAVVHSHEHEQQKNQDKKQRFEKQLRVHKISGGGR